MPSLFLNSKVMDLSVIQMSLSSPHFEDMLEGRKRYEVRLWDDKRKAIKKGSAIAFTHDQNEELSFTRIVANVEVFSTFAELFDVHDVRSVVPSVNSLDEAVALYESIGGYKEGQHEYGVACFTLL